MSIYLITILHNLNVLAFVTLMGSMAFIMAPILVTVMDKKQRKLLFIIGVTLIVFSSLWMIFAPNSALLREWAKETGYNI